MASAIVSREDRVWLKTGTRTAAARAALRDSAYIAFTRASSRAAVTAATEYPRLTSALAAVTPAQTQNAVIPTSVGSARRSRGGRERIRVVGPPGHEFSWPEHRA